MSDIRFDYIFDPLCGWCYAAAPALSALADTWPGRLTIHLSGLFSGNGARDLTPGWAKYAWQNDQRIATMTGRTFSEDYHRNVLLGDGNRFDSGPMNLALTAVRDIDATLEAGTLHRLQQARYVDGQDTARATVVARITAEYLAQSGHRQDAEALATRLQTDDTLAQATQARVEAGQSLMHQYGIQGVPQMLIHQNDEVSAVSSNALYQGADQLVAALGESLNLEPEAAG